MYKLVVKVFATYTHKTRSVSEYIFTPESLLRNTDTYFYA